MVLNRNDAKVAGGIWAEETKYEYWDVKVANPGSYDFTCHFKTQFDGEGDLSIRIGTTQRTLHNADTSANLVKFEGINLVAGDFRVESWYREKGSYQLTFPFFIEVEKRR